MIVTQGDGYAARARAACRVPRSGAPIIDVRHCFLRSDGTRDFGPEAKHGSYRRGLCPGKASVEADEASFVVYVARADVGLAFCILKLKAAILDVQPGALDIHGDIHSC